MRLSFIEVSIKTGVDSGELLAMLEDGETLGSWERDGVLHIYWPEDKWSRESLEKLKKVLGQMGANMREADIQVRSIPDRDWNAAWAASLQPIRLGRRIRVRQSWHPPDAGFHGIELVIDPKRAFGTGYHATTQLVIEWLEDHIHGGERILDVGTGSGILAMVAIRLGAVSALAVDNDPVAVECAREYAAINGFGPELELKVASFEMLHADRFDVIVANLDGKTMPRLCEFLSLLVHAEGAACLSGLQEQDYEEVSAALRSAGFQIVEKRQREDWLALVTKKTPRISGSS